MSNQKYAVNMDSINKKLQELGQSKFFKLKEGRNKIRILPPIDGSGSFYVELTHHHGFSDGQRKRAFPCLMAMKKQACPICKFYNAVKGEDENLARDVRASTTFLTNIVDRASGQIVIWSFNPKMMRGIMEYLTSDDYGPEIFDPIKGRDLSITREGQGFQTRYRDPQISPKESPIGIENWEEQVHDLNAEIEFKSYAELVKIVMAQYPDHIEELGVKFEASDLGQGLPKAAAPMKKKAAPAPVVEEEEEEAVEEELEEEDIEELDEEEEQPAPKKKLKK